jgi:hypothetical protein
MQKKICAHDGIVDFTERASIGLSAYTDPQLLWIAGPVVAQQSVTASA